MGFEQEIVLAFNRFFGEHDIRGVAYRWKQSRYTSQVVDVLVDSLDPEFYLAVECKSINLKTPALYFTQHFSTVSHQGGQIDRISRFLHLSGRRGLLAVELRPGPGRANEAYLLPWSEVAERREKGEAGFKTAEIQGFPRLPRENGRYQLNQEIFREVKCRC